MALSLAVSIRQQGFSTQWDFQVYYAAGVMVRQHTSPHLYDRPVPALDPIMRLTSPETPFAQAAARGGIENVLTYVYPPLLADLIVPVTFLNEHWAAIAWRISNTALVLLSAWLLGGLLGLGLRTRALLFLAIFFLTPVSEAISWGQIGIALLVCWVGGIVLNAKGYPRASALLLALGTAIKLTPLLAVFPMLLWGEWKWLRWYAAGVAATVGIVLLCNGLVPLEAYFHQVLPAMSAGVANFQNKTFSSALQLMALGADGRDVMKMGELMWDNASAPARVAAPGWTILAAKGITTSALALVLWLIHRLGNALSMAQRAWVFSAVATLSIALSPVSWRHSYCIAIPLLVLSWHDALNRRVSSFELLLLGLFSLETSSFFIEQHVDLVLHGATVGICAGLVPLFSLAFVIYELIRLRSLAARPETSSQPSPA
jgi:hypothetical protein